MAVSEIEHLSIFINTNQTNCQSNLVGFKFFSSASAATFTLITTCSATEVILYEQLEGQTKLDRSKQ